MGVKFLAQVNRMPQLSIEPGTYDYQADALAACYSSSTQPITTSMWYRVVHVNWNL